MFLEQQAKRLFWCWGFAETWGGNFQVTETFPGWTSTITPNLVERGTMAWNKQ
jgi:hypothetical protein